jgi:hypothetical protein
MRQVIKILDVVAVIEDLPEHNLRRGEVGTVVDRWKDGTFEVEFSNGTGEPYAFCCTQSRKAISSLLSPQRSCLRFIPHLAQSQSG